MANTAMLTLPPGVHRGTLGDLLDDARSRAALLETAVRQFERRHSGSLATLEARLDRGEGPEHPDWEDSIAWRNASESLQRVHELEHLLEWLLRSPARSPSS
jgi:hypothetical protein